MNKKLLLGALVMGMFALNSCVDDKESASVTAIRTAKAEQLKAIAEYNSAQAQAALTIANAQAAAYNAKAEYDKAMAAYQEALTEKEKAEAAIDLEAKREQLQVLLEKYKAEIAQYQYNAANYEKNLKDLQNQADKDKAQELQDLITDFDDASKDLIDAKRNLARDNAKLLELEAGLNDIAETINQDIQDLVDENAEKQVEIDAQQAIVDAYQKYAGTTVTQEEVDAAHLKMVELESAKDQASETYDDASEALNEAQQPLNNYNSEVRNWRNGNYNLSYGEWNETTERWEQHDVNIEYVDGYNQPASVRGKYCVVINYNQNNQKEYLPLFEDKNKEDAEPIEYTIQSGDQEYTYSLYKTFYNLIDGGKALETLVSYKEKQVNQWSNPEYIETLKKNLAQYQKDQTAAQTAFDAAVKKYNDAKAATETAQKAYDEANDAASKAWNAYNNNTDTEKAEALLKAANEAQAKADEAYNKLDAANTAENTAYNEKANALNTLDNATTNVNNTQELLNNSEYWAEYYAKQLADFKDAVAKLIEMGTANDANVKAWNEARTEQAEKHVDYLVADDAYSVQNSEYNTLYNAVNYNGGIVNGNWQANQKVIDAKNKIESLTQDIEDNNADIEGYKQDLADLEAGKNTQAELQKSLIEDKKAEIEKDTVSVETAQKKYDIAKSALEAAIEAE